MGDANGGPRIDQPTAGRDGARVVSDDALKRVLVLLIAATLFLGAVTGALQVDSGARAGQANRDARAYTLQAIGKSEAGILRYVYERNRLAAHQALLSEWFLARRQAEARAAAGAEGDAGAADRLWQVMEEARALSSLLSPPYFDEATFAADVLQFSVDYLVVPQALTVEREAARRAVAQAWERKADRYVLTITTLAVALFLFGLALAVKGGLRRLFTAVGCGIALLCLLSAVLTALAPTPRIASESLDLYASGLGDAYYAGILELGSAHQAVPARADRAIEALSRAVSLRPDYAAAYAVRGDARLVKAQALLLGGGDPQGAMNELERAILDYEEAIRLGRDTSWTESSLSWSLFLSGRAAEAVAAARRALALAPQAQLRFGLRLGLTLLGEAKRDEAMREVEAALQWAEGHALASDPGTFRETIRALDRLRPVAPPAGREEMERRLKEAFVSLTHRGTITITPSGASVGPLAFRTPDEESASSASGDRVFPSGTGRVEVAFDVRGIPAGALIVLKAYRNGEEDVALGTVERWTGPTTGRVQREIRAPVAGTLLGLFAGNYQVEVYVEGELLRSGRFRIG